MDKIVVTFFIINFSVLIICGVLGLYYSYRASQAWKILRMVEEITAKYYAQQDEIERLEKERISREEAIFFKRMRQKVTDLVLKHGIEKISHFNVTEKGIGVTLKEGKT